jgi:predicted ATPase/transcriptional regulator with XRE-family HTH domain
MLGDMAMEFGELLRRYRLEAGLTQKALATRAGLSVEAVGALERGDRRSPYRATFDVLAQALGLTEDERRDLAIAAQARRAAGVRGSPSRSGSQRSHLPISPTPLIGRHDEMARAADLLRRPEVRLVTLTGCPGVGKTSLCLAVADHLAAEFDDGVVLVRLAPIGAPELVGSVIADALGGSQAAGGSPVDDLATLIGSRRLLLVLDNFEHLLPAATLVSELLARCSDLHMLVTSRAILHVRGEHQLDIVPLRVPGDQDDTPEALASVPAVALFVQRARACSPSFELTAANGAAVAELCRRVDGLPLALELTAAWVRLLQPAMLLERLTDCLRMETDGPRDLAEHQRNLRATVEWSYRRLTGAHQAVFRRLSVFAGGAPVDAIDVVCQAAAPVGGGMLLSLKELVDNSMIQAAAVDGEMRLSMLEIMRAFGRERLAAEGEDEATSLSHAEWCQRLAESGEQGLYGPRQLAWVDLLEQERDNLRAGLGWARDHGRTDLALRIAGHLWRFWERRGHVSEGLAWLDDLLDREGEVAPTTRARALNAAGNLSRWGDYRKRVARYSEGLAIYRQLGDRSGICRLLNNLGMVAHDRHDHRAAMSMYEESVAIARDLDDRHMVANGLCNHAGCAQELGDLRRADELFEEANAIRRQLGDALGLARSLMNQGIILSRMGTRDRAEELMRESLDLCRSLGDHATLAYVLARRGDAARHGRRPDLARADYQAALLHAERMGATRVVITCFEGLAALASTRQETAVAAGLYGAADRLREHCGMPHPPADVLARAAMRDGRLGGQVWHAWADGKSLSLHDAINRALAWEPEQSGPEAAGRTGA